MRLREKYRIARREATEGGKHYDKFYLSEGMEGNAGVE